MRKTAPKKKMNRKMKRTIRKSLSAMFMITALVVAAIPVQENTAAGTSILAEGDEAGNEAEEPLSENSYPEETITDSEGNESKQLKTEYEIDNIRYDQLDDSKVYEGLAIVYDGSYYEKVHMYNLQKIKNSSGIAIAGYNKDITPQDNGTAGTLVIPNRVATQYVEFYEPNVKNSDYYDNGTPDKDYIKQRYAHYYTSNNMPKFDEMQLSDLAKYALNLYACDKAGESGYIAKKVTVGKAPITEAYIPYNEDTGEFCAEESYAVAAVAAGAFSDNTFADIKENTEESGSVQIFNLIIGDNIKGIGDDAFKGCENLKSLTLGLQIDSIGNHAFQNCSGLREVNMQDTVQTIGAEAFRGCNSLTAIKLPSALHTIGTGAFADCKNLSTLDMSGVTSGVDIYDFAFYNCINLSTVNFVKDGINASINSIGTGAFAVSDGLSNSITGSWKNVVFPDGVNSFGQSVLEGRSNLETCVLPQTYGASKSKKVTLDGGFFRRCSNLKSVTINGPYVQFCTELGERDCNPFWWVTSNEFYVEGPANLDDSSDYKNPVNYSYPRISTQKAQKTYKFTTKAGVEYYEIAVDCEDDPETTVDESQFTDYYLVNADTGALESYTPDSDSIGTDASTTIRIVGEYNGVSVKSIAEGCFDEVKTTATKLIVEDNTIEEISAKAFADFTALETVELGNSIKKVGEEAFAGCSALKDVYFRMDAVTIEKDAFKTNGKKGLIFHGKMESGFEPFEFAMNKENDIDGQGLRILYMTLEPSNVAAIYDNEASTDDKPAITMISYPINTADDTKAMIEENVLYEEGVKNVVIPAGVTSIDTKSYYSSDKNKSSQNTYVTGENDSITLAWKASCSTVDADASEDTVMGVFSGYYDDFNPGKNNEGENETLFKGNDYVESITMSTVESLPDYAFDSCESLKSVILGDAMKDIGIAPFRGCTSLTSVGGNSDFVSENGILYQNNGDGTYTIVQCLPGRASNTISNATDPLIDKVSKINEGAFQDCTNLKIVDLSTASNLKVIPKNCFRGCTGLTEVYLPETVNEIREGAFKDIIVNGQGSLTVQIPSTEVYINSDAFDKSKNVIIWTYVDTSAWRFAEDNDLSTKELNDDTHLVRFLDWDFSEIHSATIPHGGNVVFPSEKMPSRSGYKFSQWGCLTSGVTVESPILDDYTFIAQYTPTNGTSGSGDASGNNGNGSNSGSNGSTNGDSTNSNNGSNTLYIVTVINGSGSGSYKEGATVIITANEPATGKQFKNWTTDNTNITLASTRMSATTFTMPAGNVTVTANYEDKSSSSSSSSSGSSSTVSGNSSNRYSKNGTQVIITRPGISDTDLAAAKVNGSNEGFIVKISETAEATAAVEAALINKYGSLDNIRYCAMDISLYDSTGTTKITDTTGFTIDITIPIPDALKEYAGNNKAAAVANSQLESLSPKFTTIDGVPCVTFRATHFSPYTIYVDTQNLSATGTLDTTPKTGDGIHPKWFLSIGLACMSVVLFMKKDKRTVKVKVA